MLSSDDINKIWEKGRIVDGYDPAIIRKDACGAWILKGERGKTTLYGWEVDHVFPVSLGGDDRLINLRPMHWENNRSKGDDYPSYTARIQADGNKNVENQSQYTVNEELRNKLKQIYKI